MTDQQESQQHYYSEWLPKLHQFSFTRNESWTQSIWLGFWGVCVITLTFLFSFVLKPPFKAVWQVLMSWATGIILCGKLLFKFVFFGLLGFLSSRNVSVEDLLKEAYAKILMQRQQQEQE